MPFGNLGDVVHGWVNKVTHRGEVPKALDPVPAPAPQRIQPKMAGDVISTSDTAVVASQLTPEARAALDSLGPLLQTKDIAGKNTMLDHLANLARNDVHPSLAEAGLTKQTVLSQLVRELKDYGLEHQSYNNTCAPTACQLYMTKYHPTEFTRHMTGLAKDGQVDMVGGGTLKLEPSSIKPDGRGDRSDIDRLYENSVLDTFMNGRYDNAKDEFFNGAHGLPEDDVTRFLNAATGGVDGKFRTVNADGETIARMAQPVTDKGMGVLVAMKWPMPSEPNAAHELLVQKVQPSEVDLHNPWGKDEHAQPGQGPARRVLDNEGSIAMDRSVFDQYAYSASIPA